MEESSANKATELVVLSLDTHRDRFANAGLCDRRDVEKQISVSPRCEHGGLLMTGIASITLDVES